MLSKQSTISPESISQMVSNIMTNIKVELDPTQSLVLRFPTNSPCVVQVSHGGEKGERGVSTSKATCGNYGVVVGMVMSTRILETTSMKPIGSFSISKLQQKQQRE